MKFYIRKVTLLKESKKTFWVLTGCFILFVVITPLIYLLIQKMKESGSTMFIAEGYVVLVLAVFAVPFSVISAIATIIEINRVKRYMPGSITVFQDRILVDDKTFYYSQIDQIQLTDPSYAPKTLRRSHRQLTIVSYDKKTRFILGYCNTSNIFTSYSQLCKKLETVFFTSPNRIVMIPQKKVYI